MNLLRVSSQSNPNSVAGAVASVIRERGHVELQVIGAGALNQAIKAVAIARSFLASGGVDLVCVPSFTEVHVDGQLRTAIRLAVHDRHATIPPPEATVEAAEPAERAEQDR